MTAFGLEYHGIRNIAGVDWNLSTPALYEKIVCRNEGLISHLGPIVVRTGAYTGRSPKDKFIVYEPSSADHISWGEQNRPIDPPKFDILYARLLAFLQGGRSSSRIATPVRTPPTASPSASSTPRPGRTFSPGICLCKLKTGMN